jgi:hypothetical protein
MLDNSPSSVHLNLIVYRVVLYVLSALGKSIRRLSAGTTNDANTFWSEGARVAIYVN